MEDVKQLCFNVTRKKNVIKAKRCEDELVFADQLGGSTSLFMISYGDVVAESSRVLSNLKWLTGQTLQFNQLRDGDTVDLEVGAADTLPISGVGAFRRALEMGEKGYQDALNRYGGLGQMYALYIPMGMSSFFK